MLLLLFLQLLLFLSGSFLYCYAYSLHNIAPLYRINNKVKLFSFTELTPTEQVVERAVYITGKAMTHIQSLKEKKKDTQVLRMGVKAGGCSGMSYSMDFISDHEINEDDYIEDFDSIKCAIDPKSILFLYGMQLDYSDELIGGGFKFQNPNSETTCGCGKSFGI